MSFKSVIGVMGPSRATNSDQQLAEKLGRLIAQNDWITLSGGGNVGVMDAVNRGAKEAGGLVVGILPSKDKEGASKWLDVAVVSGMGSARNNINVLSSDVVVACGTLSSGTLSEVALAISAGKNIIVLGKDTALRQHVKKLASKQVSLVSTPEKAISKIKSILT